MRTVLYALILVAVLIVPVDRLDIAKLQPVEAVAISIDEGSVILQTDVGSYGKGKTAIQALENLKANTAAVVYLDTAQYLLIGEKAEKEAQQLMPHLKRTVQLGPYFGGEVKEEVKYLSAHMDAEKPN